MQLFDLLMKQSTRATEAGLLFMDSALKNMQSTIGMLAGQRKPEPSIEPPVDGPPTLDEATSAFANHLIRIAWTTSSTSPDLQEVWQELVHAAKKSFSGLDLVGPLQWMALPFQLPLSFGSLLTQEALRGFYAGYVIGPEKMPGFAVYMLESFTDVQVFISLQYKELVARFRREVKRTGGEPKARLKLAQTLMKMGLYRDAAKEFRAAAGTPAVRAEALSESVVAHFRSGAYAEAMKDGVDSLAVDPGRNRTRFWMWLAAQQMGGYPTDVPADCRIEIKAGLQQPKVELEDVAEEIGIDKTAAGRGTAVFDMDGDGYLDVVTASAHGGCNVYRNRGDGTFEDVTIGSGLEACVNSFIIAVGDYNNDGLDDLFITRLGFYPGDSVLYRNNGDGTFTDVTREAGVSCWGPGFVAQWVDYDCDGHLDLFVANNLGGIFDRKTPNRLFHNNGDGTFTEVSKQAGLESIVPSIGAAWGDYNNDGYPDLFVSNGVGRSQLFRNNGDGTFTEVGSEAGVDVISLGSVALWADYDNDGWLDIIQFTWSPEEDVLHTLIHGEGPAHGHPMRIFHNNRNGTFTMRNRDLGINGCWGTMSGTAGDFNNDGYLDFLLGNGDPHMNRTEPPTLLEFDAALGKYRNVSFAAGLPCFGKGHGMNMADLGGDGRLCLLLASGGAYPGDLITMSVFRPKVLPGNYLNVRLVGTKSNRNAVGARLRLDADGRSVHLLVSGGSGFGSAPYEQHFGLGHARHVDCLEILWPSGSRQRLENLPVNNTIRITEGKAGYEEVYRNRHEPARITLPLSVHARKAS